MAVTGFWPVFKNLKATLDYADNPDKTTAPEYLDEDLYAALRYAENDNKTDRKMFVGGINCSAQNAYAEMIAIQRRFGLRGKVVGYHGIQSFREGEVTPEQAFAIGKETARRMWGERYQVLVTVHLNTDNIHCHFVVNPVSFKDGAKFKNKIGDHKELRKISDEICREHELSVLENSDFYSKGKKKEYWVHKAGKKTHRDYLREDVEYCLSFATSPREFESQLYALGYTLDPVRFSVKAKHWERAVRLSGIGFSKDRVNEQLRQNAEFLKLDRVNQAKKQVAMFNAMYEEYVSNEEITKARMYFEAIEAALPGVKLVIDAGGNTQKLLPLESFINGQQPSAVNPSDPVEE